MQWAILASLWLCCYCSDSPTVAPTHAPTLPPFAITLLHTGDIRSSILPVNSFNSLCSMGDVEADPSSCFGGAARRVTYVSQVRNNRTTPVFLVDTGNIFHGSLYLAKFKGGTEDRYFFNLLNYSALALGVEDFFTNNDDLKSFLTDLQVVSEKPVVSNLDVSDEPLLAGRLQTWAVVEDKNVKIGIVSVISSVLPQHSNSGPNVKVKDSLAAVRVAVTLLKSEHPDCNIVILLSNALDDREDVSIASSIYDIDIVVQGNRVVRKKGDPISPYPRVVMNEIGNPVLFVSAGDRGALIGDLQVTFSGSGLVESWDGDAILLTNSTPVDPSTWLRVKSSDAQIQEFKNQIVGNTTRVMDQWTEDGKTTGCSWWDCPLGRLIAEAEFAACPECDFAIQNAGGIKANIPAGPISLGAIYSAFPFQNTMVTMNLVGGSALVEVFRNAVNRTNGPGSFVHLKGVRFAYNPNVSDAREIIALIQVQNRITKVWEDASATRVYRIAVNNFIAGGGDGFEVLAREGFDVNFYYPDLTALAATYLMNLTAPVDWMTSVELEGKCTTVTPLVASQNGSVWPYPECQTLRTSVRSNWLTQCATSPLCEAGIEVVDGVTVGDCSACSGLGSCSQRVCECVVPPEGLFAGQSMVRGADCSEVRREDVLSEGLKGFLYFLIALTAFLAVTSSLGYMYFYKMAAIKRSQPLFVHIILVGAMLACAGLVIDLQPVNLVSCWVREVLFSLCFTLSMGSLFVRSYRIYRMLVFRSLKDIKIIRTPFMLLLLGIIVGIDLIILLLRALLEPVEISPTLHTSAWEYDVRCFSSASHPLQFASNAYKGIILCFGVFIAFQTRKIPVEEFNDSSAIAFCIYNTALISIICLPVNSALVLKQQLVLEVFVYCYVGISTVIRLLGPKFRLISIGEGNRSLPQNMSSNKSNSGVSMSASQPSVLNTMSEDGGQYRDPVYLNAKIKETTELLESLRSMLARVQEPGTPRSQVTS